MFVVAILMRIFALIITHTHKMKDAAFSVSFKIGQMAEWSKATVCKTVQSSVQITLCPPKLVK